MKKNYPGFYLPFGSILMQASKVPAFLLSFMMFMIAGNSFGQLTLVSSPYNQNFNNIGTGLPTGWTVRTGATATALGTTASLTTTATAWSSTTGQFANLASANSPSAAGDVAATQSSRTDRALALRQTSAVGDPGGAFVLQLANTTGFTSFNLSFKLMELDPSATAGRTATWNVDYGFGSTPTSFTNATTSPATISTTQGSAGWGSTTVTVNFGTALDNNSGPVWIRIVTKSATSGSGTRPQSAIDDVNLTFSSASVPVITNSPLTINGTVGTAITPFTITASNSPTSFSTGSLPAGLSFSSPTISGTPTAAGTYSTYIKASNSAGRDSQTVAITIAQGSQSISFGTLATKTYGDGDFTLSATSATSSINPITYTSLNTAVATVSGNTVHIVGAGTATIRASQAGNADYTAATNVDRTLTVNQASQTISFGALANKYDTSADYQLTASSSAGLAITYSSSNTSVATIGGTNGDYVHIVGSGNATITAAQAGNANYAAASNVSQSLTVTSTAKTNQTISFGSLAGATYGDNPIKLTATASSNLPVAYSSNNTSVAVVSNDTIYIVGVGTATITASQGGDGSYNPATNVTQDLVVGQKALTVTGATAQNKAYNGNDAAVITGATLVGIVSPDVVTVSGGGHFADVNVNTGIAVTAALTLNGADNAKYTLIQPTGLTADITPGSQSITGFTAFPTKTFGNAPFALSATSTSGGTVTYASSNPSVATISGSSVTITGAGTTVITASQAGGGNYAAAPDTSLTLTVNQAAQTITFAALSGKVVGDADYTLTGTTTSGLTITYTSSNTAVATVTGNTVHIVGAGTTNITAAQAGNTNYTAATSVVRALTVTYPVIAGWDFTGIGSVSNTTVAATTFSSNLVAASGANNISRGAGAAWSTAANSYRTAGFKNDGISTSNTDYFQITLSPSTGNTMSLSAINANVAGTASFGVTPGVSNQFAYSTNGTSFTLIGSPSVIVGSSGSLSVDLTGISALQNVAAGTTITIRYYASGQTTTGGWGFTSSAAGVNGLAIGGTVAALPRPVITSSLTANGTVGTGFSYGITATNAPSSYSTSALPAGLSLSGSTISGIPTAAGTYFDTVRATNNAGTGDTAIVITIAKGNQTIGNFAATATKIYQDADYTLSATSTSGGTVTYASSNTSVATVSGNTVHIVGAGTTNITASQSGDANWNAAPDSIQVLTVNKKNQTITFGTLTDKLSTDADYQLTGTASSGLPVSYSSSATGVITIVGANGDSVHIVAPGTANITASQAGDANWNAASSVTRSQFIIDNSKSNQTISFAPLSNVTYGDGTFTLTATASSDSVVTYTSSNTAVATVSGNTVTIVAPGTTIITAHQAGNSLYNPAPDTAQSLTVLQKTLTLNGATAQDKTFDSTTTATVTGASLSGVVGTDNVTFSGPANFSNSNAGTWAVTTSYTLGGADAAKYLLTQASLSATINKANQTITFGALAAKTTASAPFALTATASSHLAVSYSSSVTSVATVAGSTATIVDAGSTVITASQAGDANYNAATSVDQSLVVTVAPSIVIWNFGTTSPNAAPSSGTPVTNLTISNMGSGKNANTSQTGIQISTTSPSTTPTYSGQENAATTAFNGSFDTSKTAYFEFTLTPAAGKKVTLNSISLGSRSTGTGPTTLDIRTNRNGFASTIGAASVTASSSWVAFAPSVTATTSNGSNPLVVRIYGYVTGGAGTVTGSSANNWRIDDVNLSVSVNTIPACSGTPAAGTVTAGTSTFCNSGSTLLTLNGAADANANTGISYQWYSSTDNSSFSPVSGATGTTLATGTLTQTTYYYVTTGCSASGLSATSNTFAVTINQSSTSTTTVTACNSYTWNGNVYTNTGSYVNHFTNAAGCDSAATLALTINYSNNTASTVTACNAYTWHETVYSTSGTYTFASTNGTTGCTDTDTLYLTINQSSTSTTTATACDHYTWNGTTYTTSGTYTYSTTNAVNCDSIATLELTINNSSSSTTTISACGSFVWNGTTYTTSGVYIYGTGNAVGCDSTATLVLTINQASSSSTAVSACDSYTWNGSTYTNSGTYTYLTTNAAGCDSTATLDLTVHYSSSSKTTISACDSYSWNGNTYTSSGIYTYVTTNSDGCPHTDTLILNLGHSSSSLTSVTVCGNQLPQVWNGISFSGPADTTLHFTNASGCDSAARYILSVNVFTLDTIVGPKNVCTYVLPVTGGNATYSVSAVNAATYTWTVPTGAAGASIVSGQGTNTITVHFNATYSGTVATNNKIRVTVTSACGSPLKDSMVISKATPPVPGAISGPTNPCPYVGSGTPVTYSIAPVGGVAVTYRWTLPVNVSLVSASPDSTSITVLFNSAFATNASTQKAIKVRSVSGCGTSSDKTLALTTTAPATPGTIAGSTNACIYIGSSNVATYTIKKVPNAGYYLWTVPAGATIASHPGGAGTANDTIITVAYDAGFVDATPISVQAVSGCGTSAAKTLLVRRNLPTLPAAILTNVTDVCTYVTSTNNPTGTPIAYYIHPVAAAQSYVWTAPAGATVSHQNADGILDTLIYVTFPSGFTTGTVAVACTNGCGTTNTRTKSVSITLPAMPGTITGPVDACPFAYGGTDATYSIKKVALATEYHWSVSDAVNAHISGHPNGSGANDTVITVHFDGTYAGGTINVRAARDCGESAAKTLSVAKAVPAKPIISGPSSACPGSTQTFTASAATGTTYTWTVPAAMGTFTGQGTNQIQITFKTTFNGGSISAKTSSVCGTSAASVNFAIAKGTCTGISGNNPIAKVNAVNFSDVLIYPNPSNGAFNIAINTGNQISTDAVVDIVNGMGQTVYHQAVKNSVGVINLHIANQLSNGIYLVNCWVNGQKVSKKLTINQ